MSPLKLAVPEFTSTALPVQGWSHERLAAPTDAACTAVGTAECACLRSCSTSPAACNAWCTFWWQAEHFQPCRREELQRRCLLCSAWRWDLLIAQLQHSAKTLQCAVQGKQLALAASWKAASCCAQTLLVQLWHFASTLQRLHRVNRMPGCSLILRKKVAACSARRRVERHDEFDCTLCSNLLHQPITTPCGHSFCRLCFQRAFDHSNKCPLCRTVRRARLCRSAPTVHRPLCRTAPAAWLECVLESHRSVCCAAHPLHACCTTQ